MKVFFISILFFSAQLLFAQEQKALDFLEETHDFGEVNEQDGPINYEFEFTNTGASPLIISNVKASCGCTTPAWSKEPVLPGEKGFVQARYNPLNRPGAFNKSLTITHNGEGGSSVVYIKGKVIPRVKTIEEELRILTGTLRTKSKTVNMGRITTQNTTSRTIDVYNDGDAAFSFIDKYQGPDFVKLTFEPMTLQPKQKGVLKIEYDPNYNDNLGFQNHNVRFFTDEPEDAEKELNLMATISEYFAPLDEKQAKKAPKLDFDVRMSDLGKMQQDGTAVAEFELKNTGKSPLNIRKVISNCNCLVTNLKNYDLKPGKSTILTAEFTAKGRRGSQLKSITVYSNDPANPTQLVSVKAQVERKE